MALSSEQVWQTIADFARARLAQQAGYDGVEVMGSEGYLINQFIAARTNQRDDEWGGSYQNRIRFALEILKAVREAVGPNFIIIYRLSMLDLVEEGSSFDECRAGAGRRSRWRQPDQHRHWLARGAHPHHRHPGAARRLCLGDAKLMGKVGIPLITTNRINTPDVAEQVLAEGCADMVSMARPFLADPAFVAKAADNRADEINTCIGCNQACLDHIFAGKLASCLVNPLACHETERVITPAAQAKRVAVVGAGPAGLSCAVTAAQRGHAVTLFDAASEIGGQFNVAKQIPGRMSFRKPCATLPASWN